MCQDPFLRSTGSRKATGQMIPRNIVLVTTPFMKHHPENDTISHIVFHIIVEKSL